MNPLLRFAAAALTLVLASACSPQPAATPSASTDVKGATSSWGTFELPLRGIGAPFPETPHLNVRGLDQGAVHIEMQELVLEKDGIIYDLAASEFSTEGKPLPQDESNLARIDKLFKTIKQRRDLMLGGFPGVELRGTTAKGEERLIRAYVVGGSLLTWAADASSGKFSEDLARRFVEGGSFQLPWRVFSTPEGRFSVSVPRLALEMTRDELGWEKDFTGGAGFFVGGKGSLIYAAGSVERPSPDPRTDDEVADAMAGAMAERGEVIYTAPLDYEGARARDMLAIFNGMHFRVRVIVTSHYGYLLMAGANDKATVLDNSQQRFFSSLRWYQE